MTAPSRATSSHDSAPSSNLFDITMSSYDGAESCELVGAYLLYLIREEFRDTCDFGLYRDDGL